MRWPLRRGVRMTVMVTEPPTEEEAQALHEQGREIDPEHDPCGCWCCCITCDFDTKAIFARSEGEQP